MCGGGGGCAWACVQNCIRTVIKVITCQRHLTGRKRFYFEHENAFTLYHLSIGKIPVIIYFVACCNVNILSNAKSNVLVLSMTVHSK